MIHRFCSGVVAAFLLSVALCARADAAAPSASLTKLCSAATKISFTVVDISQPQMPGSTTCSFSMTITTTANPGVVTLTAPAITGTGGTIPRGAFWGNCTATSDPSGVFTSSGTVQLGTSAVTCGTIPTHTTGATVIFTVTLYVDDTGDSTAFPADTTYGSANLTVTANAN